MNQSLVWLQEKSTPFPSKKYAYGMYREAPAGGMETDSFHFPSISSGFLQGQNLCTKKDWDPWKNNSYLSTFII